MYPLIAHTHTQTHMHMHNTPTSTHPVPTQHHMKVESALPVGELMRAVVFCEGLWAVCDFGSVYVGRRNAKRG